MKRKMILILKNDNHSIVKLCLLPKCILTKLYLTVNAYADLVVNIHSVNSIGTWHQIVSQNEGNFKFAFMFSGIQKDN